MGKSQNPGLGKEGWSMKLVLLGGVDPGINPSPCSNLEVVALCPEGTPRGMSSGPPGGGTPWVGWPGEGSEALAGHLPVGARP